jgi:hypothetical protein
MKVIAVFMKVFAIFWLLGIIAYLLSPFRPQNLYKSYTSWLTWLTGLVYVLLALWPGFEDFLRKLPLAVRFLFPIFCAFLAFLDIRTRGFTLDGIIRVYIPAGFTAGYILSIKKQE